MIRYSSGGVDSPCDCQWICGKTTSTRYMMSTSRENVPLRNIGKVSNGMKKHRVGLKTFYLMFVSKIEFQADKKKEQLTMEFHVVQLVGIYQQRFEHVCSTSK